MLISAFLVSWTMLDRGCESSVSTFMWPDTSCSPASICWLETACEAILPLSRPAPGPVLDGIGDVGWADLGGAFQVGDGAGDLQDAVVGPGREVHLRHGGLQDGLGRPLHLTVLSHLGLSLIHISEPTRLG